MSPSKDFLFAFSSFCSIRDVFMSTAVDQNTGQPKASSVERCSCPEGYKGLSCERCQSTKAYYVTYVVDSSFYEALSPSSCEPGYTRSSAEGLYLGVCRPCNCYGMASACDVETGVCQDCREHTEGANCERCHPGYEGDPTRGIVCRPKNGRPEPCRCDPAGSLGDGESVSGGRGKKEKMSACTV